MVLDKDTVCDIARLAHIRIPEEDLEHLAGDISSILDWIEQLNEVDIKDVAPMTSVVETSAILTRADVVNDGACSESVLANAPEREDDFYTVPRVVE